MASVIRFISEEASFCSQEFEAMLEAVIRKVEITYPPVAERAEAVSPHDCWFGVDMWLSPLDSEAIRRDRDAYVRHKRIFGDWGSLANTVVPGNRTYGCGTVSMDEIQAGRPPREHRFDVLRAEGKKLGEINTILEEEGYSEVFGEGVMPAPTKSHQIVRENKGARKMVETMGGR